MDEYLEMRFMSQNAAIELSDIYLSSSVPNYKSKREDKVG